MFGDRDYKILLLSVPPRHGKSQQATIDFPAWYLGRNPDKEIITASYSSELAQDFGTKTRTKIESEQYQNIFPSVHLKADERAKAKWKTSDGGSYTSVGVGGPITGRGADIMIIDDPVKNREEANSEVYRSKIWEWFTSTAFTRLEPGAVVIVILCMTGDTPVLMGDGTERLLKDIRVGDKIATFDKGKLAVSTVKNWSSNGHDNVLKITTSSGKIVRANERHPFLIYEKGKLTWIPVKNLHIEQKIVTKRHSGVNGKEKSVSSKNVGNKSLVEDIAHPIMERKNGLMDTDHHRPTQNHIVKVALNIFMGLRFKNITDYIKSRVENALFVANFPKKMLWQTGEESSVLTTATIQKRFADYFVMTAILQLVIQKLKILLLLFRNTSDFILEDIISIESDGMEEVYDLQVENTENFIANGVVSHNTRWHDDDLAGKIIEHPELSKRIKIMNFPAIAEIEDPYRHEGQVLWPKKYPKIALEEIRTTVGPYDWASLYQQTPILSENQEFKNAWFKQIGQVEVERMNTRKFLTIDTAMSKRASADFTGFCDNSINTEKFWHLKAWQAKIGPEELVDTIFALHRERKYEKIGIEKTAYLDGLKPFLDSEQRKRGVFLPIVELFHNSTAKEVRVRGLIPRYASGSVFHIDGYCTELENQMVRFPFGVHDDIIDAVAYQEQIVGDDEELMGRVQQYRPKSSY